MFADLTVLIRRDHDDLDRTLTAMTDPTISRDDAVALLDAYRIGLTAHAVAQTTVLPDVLGPIVTPQALARIMQGIFEEHRDQALALAALASERSRAG